MIDPEMNKEKVLELIEFWGDKYFEEFLSHKEDKEFTKLLESVLKWVKDHCTQ